MQSTATISIDGIDYTVEYDWTPADPGGPFEPPTPEQFEVTAVFDEAAGLYVHDDEIDHATVVAALKAL